MNPSLIAGASAHYHDTATVPSHDPPESPAAERHARLLDVLSAADHLFAGRGYHATTMDEVAHRAGVSKPTVYKHFSCKLALYLAVLDRHIDTLAHSIGDAMHSTAGNHHKLAAAVRTFFEFIEQGTTGFTLLFDTPVISEPSVQWRLRQVDTTCTEAVSEVIAAAGLTKNRARLIAAALVGMAKTAARDWHAGGCHIEKDDAVDLVVTMCWSGLSRAGARSPARA